MASVHVEIPSGDQQSHLLEVQRTDLPQVTDEQDLGVAYGDVPGLPGYKIVVFTEMINGPEAVAHVEIPPNSDTVLLEVPAAVGLPVDDEADLLIVPNIPGAVLVCLKTP